MLEVTMKTPNGKNYLLTGAETESPVLAPLAALETLVGQATRSDQVVPSRAGVLAGRTRWGALEQEIEFYIHADTGEEMNQIYTDFRQGLKVWAPERPVPPKPAVLEILTDHPMAPLHIDVWLARPLPGTTVDMSTRTSHTITAALFNPVSLFRTRPRRVTGTATVNNLGDAIIYPRLEGKAAGGTVRFPSGAVWQWPSRGGPLSVNLDPRELKTPGAFPEGVPPGRKGTYQVPAGVEVVYELLYADAWA